MQQLSDSIQSTAALGIEELGKSPEIEQYEQLSQILCSVTRCLASLGAFIAGEGLEEEVVKLCTSILKRYATPGACKSDGLLEFCAEGRVR